MRSTAVILLLTLLCSFYSCKKELSLSSEEETLWLNIMEDIYVAKSASQKMFGKNRDSLEQVYFQEVYAKYNIDSMQIDSFLDTMMRAKLLEGFYEQLLEQVSVREDSLKQEGEEEED